MSKKSGPGPETVLPSGLETIDYGTQGWNNINTANVELLDSRLVHPMTANDIFGTVAVADDNSSQSDPQAQQSETLTGPGTNVSTVIKTISGSGADADLNDNFSSMVDQHNKIIAEIADLISVVAGAIDYTDAQKAKINELLGKLRKSTGVGVLADAKSQKREGESG